MQIYNINIYTNHGRLLVWSGCFGDTLWRGRVLPEPLPACLHLCRRMILPEPIAVRTLPRCIFVTVCGVRYAPLKAEIMAYFEPPDRWKNKSPGTPGAAHSDRFMLHYRKFFF